MSEYDHDAQELEDNFKKNQEREQQEFEEELENSVIEKVRPSSKLLNMKYRMEQLSKYQRFEEAAKLQTQYEKEVRIQIYKFVCWIEYIDIMFNYIKKKKHIKGCMESFTVYRY